MIRLLLVSVILLAFNCASAQNTLYSIKNSEFSLYSKAPLEDIEAVNTQARSIINIASKEMVVRIPITQFQFRNRLMQQHFNENYMESEKYPFAEFKGKINEALDFSKAGVYTVSASGILNIHGIPQERTITGKLIIGNNALSLDTRFDVMLKDHKIDIPKLVFNKIAEKIAVSASINYIPYKK